MVLNIDTIDNIDTVDNIDRISPIMSNNNNMINTTSTTHNETYDLLNEIHDLSDETQFNTFVENNVKCCIENIGKGAFGTITKGIDMSTGKSIIIKTIIIKTPTAANATYATDATDATDATHENTLHTDFSMMGGSRYIIPATVATSTLLSMTTEDKHKIDKIKKEINVMRKLKHDCIIDYIGQKIDKSNNGYIIKIFMEDVCGKSLDVLFNLTLTPHFINMIALQILIGLEYMHSQNIVHKDIKAKNILLSNAGEIKIIDFGESVYVDTYEVTHILAGTSLYMSPEVIQERKVNKKNSFKCDIWAAAILIVELHIGATIKSKFDNHIMLMFGINANPYLILHECIHALLCKIKNIEYMPIDITENSDIKTHIEPLIKELLQLNANASIISFVDFLCVCLEPDVTKRYDADDALWHPFITKQYNEYTSEIFTSISPRINPATH